VQTGPIPNELIGIGSRVVREIVARVVWVLFVVEENVIRGLLRVTGPAALWGVQLGFDQYDCARPARTVGQCQEDVGFAKPAPVRPEVEPRVHYPRHVHPLGVRQNLHTILVVNADRSNLLDCCQQPVGEWNIAEQAEHGGGE
jgi:hypothetical protein